VWITRLNTSQAAIHFVVLLCLSALPGLQAQQSGHSNDSVTLPTLPEVHGSTELCVDGSCMNMTNLHFHGLHVSSDSPQDDVLSMMAKILFQ
jgi:hypothetical protein